jgi:hypothetical protein
MVHTKSAGVPMSERWLHEPGMLKKLEQADQWMRQNPPQETDLAELESSKLSNDGQDLPPI